MKDKVMSDSWSEVDLEVPEKYWEAYKRIGSIEKTLAKIVF